MSDGFCCRSFKVLKRRDNSEDAEALLRKIALQVEPIMRHHEWRVTVLEEFFPQNSGLLGMNVNRSKILIRLRPASSPGSFLPYESLLGTMLHELTHMRISAHSAKFYRLLDELRSECEALMSKGIVGARDAHAFAGRGSRAGGERPVGANVRALALKAAERRARRNRIMDGGGRKLGARGNGSANGRSLRELVADAAERRQRDEHQCRAVLDGKLIIDLDEMGENEGGAQSRSGDESVCSATVVNASTVSSAATASSRQAAKISKAPRPRLDVAPLRSVESAAQSLNSAPLPGGFDPCRPIFSSGGAARAAILLGSAAAPNTQPPPPANSSRAAAWLGRDEGTVIVAPTPGPHVGEVVDLTSPSPERVGTGHMRPCARCTFANSPSRTRCSMCEGALTAGDKRRRCDPESALPVASSIEATEYNSPLVAGGEEESQWDCPCCTLLNECLHLQCDACGELRPNSAKK